MKAHGNGSPETCAANLLRITRGEVPFDRVRGRDAALVDAANVGDDAIADAEWVLETYEPRVDPESIEANAEDALLGDFELAVDIVQRKEDEDEE